MKGMIFLGTQNGFRSQYRHNKCSTKTVTERTRAGCDQGSLHTRIRSHYIASDRIAQKTPPPTIPLLLRSLFHVTWRLHGHSLAAFGSAGSTILAVSLHVTILYGKIFWLYHQNHICISLLPNAYYMPYPSHPPWLEHSNYTWRTVEVIKFIIM
jgi:hypothetical protein